MSSDMMECWVVMWWNNSNSHGLVFADRRDRNKCWLGGSKSLVFIPVFESKEVAKVFARKARRLNAIKNMRASVWIQKLERY